MVLNVGFWIWILHLKHLMLTSWEFKTPEIYPPLQSPWWQINGINLKTLHSKESDATCSRSYLRIQSRARMKKSLLSWCSSRRRAHCSNVTDMDVRSLALLQLVNLMPFNLRQIWREVRRRQQFTGTPNTYILMFAGRSGCMRAVCRLSGTTIGMGTCRNVSQQWDATC